MASESKKNNWELEKERPAKSSADVTSEARTLGVSEAYRAEDPGKIGTGRLGGEDPESNRASWK